MSGYKFYQQITGRRFISWSQIFFCLYCSNPLASDLDPVFSHDSVRWTRLVYEASAFFVTLETEISLHVLDAKSTHKDLVLNDKPDINVPNGENIFRIDTHADGFGKKTTYQLWFNPNGETLQRKKLSAGKKNHIKLHRFSSCGYYYLRQNFPNNKFDKNYNQWNQVNASFSTFPEELCKKDVIYDINALFYLISALNIKKAGYEREILTFSRGKIIPLKITANKVSSIYSDFAIKSKDGTKEIEGDLDVLQVRLIPMTSDKKLRDSFRFLGLKGNVKVYIDTTNQLIVRLSGKVDVVGSIEINLKKAEFSR